jgi:hypothetical protein
MGGGAASSAPSRELTLRGRSRARRSHGPGDRLGSTLAPKGRARGNVDRGHYHTARVRLSARFLGACGPIASVAFSRS